MVYAIRTANRSFKVGYSKNVSKRMNDYCSYDVTIMWHKVIEGSKKTENAIQKELEEMGFTRQRILNRETHEYYRNEFFSQPKDTKAQTIEDLLTDLLDRYAKAD